MLIQNSFRCGGNTSREKKLVKLFKIGQAILVAGKHTHTHKIHNVKEQEFVTLPALTKAERYPPICLSGNNILISKTELQARYRLVETRGFHRKLVLLRCTNARILKPDSTK